MALESHGDHSSFQKQIARVTTKNGQGIHCAQVPNSVIPRSRQYSCHKINMHVRMLLLYWLHFLELHFARSYLLALIVCQYLT